MTGFAGPPRNLLSEHILGGIDSDDSKATADRWINMPERWRSGSE
jgi:hypothetical protein